MVAKPKVGVFFEFMKPRPLIFFGWQNKPLMSGAIYCVRFYIIFPHAVWSFFFNWRGCNGVLVMLEILAVNVPCFVLKFCVKH